MLDLDSPADTSAGPRPGAAPPRQAPVGRWRQRHPSTLDDDDPVTVWSADDRGSGALTITLNWQQLTTSTGLPRPSDIQLGCFWQTLDGRFGVVQALDNRLSAPGGSGGRQVLRLGRRQEQEGQALFVDLGTLETLHRFFVFAYGMRATPEWETLRPVLTVSAASGKQLTMRVGEGDSQANIFLLASFHVWRGDLVIRREDVPFPGFQQEAAAAHGFDLEWNPDGRTVRLGP